jgi:hypothetical protein
MAAPALYPGLFERQMRLPQRQAAHTSESFQIGRGSLGRPASKELCIA